MEELFTPKQAAVKLKVSRMTIFRWLKSGRLNAVIIAGQRFISEAEIQRKMRNGSGDLESKTTA